ncbi:MAG TPA: DinB family protein [Thermomicrobiales bacterium]|nr:DinB family protein [Thermomicrobiales bacterium]
MIDQDDIDQLLDNLREYPDRLRDLTAGVDDDELSRAAAGGGWGPVEIFCHLRDIEELFVERVGRILNEDDPFLAVVDESLWPIERDYAAQNARVALEQFAENRSQFTRLLSRLDAPDWHRRGHHAELGEQTVLWYARHAAEHDVVHEQQLRDLLA